MEKKYNKITERIIFTAAFIMALALLLAPITVQAQTVMVVSNGNEFRDALYSGVAGRTIILLNDINLGAWVPSYRTNASVGNFILNGNGFALTFSVSLKDSSQYPYESSQYAGLIGRVDNGNIIIRNLEIRNSSISVLSSSNIGQLYAGGLIGLVNGGRIEVENTSVKGGLIRAERDKQSSAVNAYAGGFFGAIQNADVAITESSVDTTIEAIALAKGNILPPSGNNPRSYAGGFVGMRSGGTLTITGSHAAGSVLSYAHTANIWDNASRFAGDLVGDGSATVINSTASNTLQFEGNGSSKKSILATAAQSVVTLQYVFPNLPKLNSEPILGDRLPYRDGTALVSVREPMFGTSQTSSDTVSIYGKNARLATAMSAANGYQLETQNIIPKLSGSVNLEGQSVTLEIVSIHHAYEADFTGDGKKNQLAVIAAARASIYGFTIPNISFLVLCVGDAEFAESGQPFTLIDVIVSSASLLGIGGYDSASSNANKSALITADVNGDGIDEIIVALPNKNQLDVWSMNKDDNNWSRNILPIEGIQINANNGYTISIAAGDVDRDGCEDIVYALSYHDFHLDFDWGSSSWGSEDFQYTAYIVYGGETLSDLETQPIPLLDANETLTRQNNPGGIGVTIADMDGDGNKQILVAYRYDVRLEKKLNPFLKKAWVEIYCDNYSVYRFDFDYRNRSFTKDFVFNRKITPNLVNKATSGLFSGHTISDVKVHASALQIAKLDYDYGVGKGVLPSGSIVVNGVVFSYARRADGEYDINYEANLGTAGGIDGSIDRNVKFISLRRAIVSGDSDGFLMHYLNGGVSTVAYYDYRSKTTNSKTGGYNEMFTESKSGWFYTALPDIDNDSVYLVYTQEPPILVWSDPVIQAVLVHPPFFKALPHPPEGINFNPKTGWSATKANGTGKPTLSKTINSGTYINFELGILSAQFEYALEETISKTVDYEEVRTITHSRGANAENGQDAVVLSTLASDVYRYKRIFPMIKGGNVVFDENGDIVTEEEYINVTVPRNAMHERPVTFEQYNEIRENVLKHGHVLPDLSEIFTHKIGFPETYQDPLRNMATSRNLISDSVVFSDHSYGFPLNYLPGRLGIDITENTVTKTLTVRERTHKMGGGTSLDISAGMGAGLSVFRLKFTVGGIWGGADSKNGDIVTDAEGDTYEGVVYGQGDTGADFTWRLLRYLYTNNPDEDKNINTMQFPVITYEVAPGTIRYPVGVIPQSVTVTPDYQQIPMVSGYGVEDRIQIRITSPEVSRAARTVLVGAPNGMWLSPSSSISSDDVNRYIYIDGQIEHGIYPLRMEVGGVESNYFIIDVTERARRHDLAWDPDAIDFPNVKLLQGAYEPPSARQITVTSVHPNQWLRNLESGISGVSNSAFEITEQLSSTELAPGASAEISVRPKAGLQPGTYNATLNVTDGESFAFVNLYFTVEPPDATAFADMRTAIANFNNGGGNTTIVVGADFEIENGLAVSGLNGTLTIKSADPENPVTLTRGAGGDLFAAGDLFTVYDGARLILENIIIDGNKYAYWDIPWSMPRLVYVDGGEFIMRDGAVLKNNWSDAVEVNEGTFIMDGGEISGNCGGVSVNGDYGIFTMYRGAISNNCGGVYVWGENGVFTMYGGEISHNSGSGVSVSGEKGVFDMHGGEISHNTAYYSGGVYISGGEFIMRGGEISCNIAEWGSGGGIFIDYVFDGFGSGDYVYGGKVTMLGGKIINNSAIAGWDGGYGYGGGVYVLDKFTMLGGEISGNTADYGGGVYADGDIAKITLGGTAVISDNVFGNVYLRDGIYISLGTGEDAPAPGMRVGVQTETEDRVIVQSGANPGDEEYFFSDEFDIKDAKVEYEDGQLLIAFIDYYSFELEGIEITTPPVKTVYAARETLDLTGMVVTATYTGGFTDVLMIYETIPADGYILNMIGQFTVTVRYGDKTAGFTITVKGNQGGVGGGYAYEAGGVQYSLFEDVLANIPDFTPFEIKLLDNVDSPLTIEGKIIVLDLNGYDLTGGIFAASGSIVTLTGDVSGEVAAQGDGTIMTVEGDVHNGAYAWDYGAINISGDIHDGYAYAWDYGTVTIGGDVYDGYVYAWDNGAVVINGDVYGKTWDPIVGEPASSGSEEVYGNVMVYAGGTVTINGELKVEDDNYYVMIDGQWLAKQEGSSSTVKPGYFEYTIDGTSSTVWVKHAASILYGDVNGDGKVDEMDVVALERYLAHWPVSINESAADLNSDGLVDEMDIVVLERYLARWPGYEKLPIKP